MPGTVVGSQVRKSSVPRPRKRVRTIIYATSVKTIIATTDAENAMMSVSLSESRNCGLPSTSTQCSVVNTGLTLKYPKKRMNEPMMRKPMGRTVMPASMPPMTPKTTQRVRPRSCSRTLNLPLTTAWERRRPYHCWSSTSGAIMNRISMLSAIDCPYSGGAPSTRAKIMVL